MGVRRVREGSHIFYLGKSSVGVRPVSGGVRCYIAVGGTKEEALLNLRDMYSVAIEEIQERSREVGVVEEVKQLDRGSFLGWLRKSVRVLRFW